MRLSEVDFGGGTPVDAYGPGFFRLGETVVEDVLLILPGEGGGDIIPVKWGDLDPVLKAASHIDVLFVGMGADIAPLEPEVMERLTEAGIGVEVMGTPSACRTYNVLLSEGRRVGLLAKPV